MKSFFQHFSGSIEGIELPDKFTFPFYYEPHPLCLEASEQVQEYLTVQSDFEHNFGIIPNKKGLPIGKMFGVLVVQNRTGEIGYLAAVSGKLGDRNDHTFFVPPVFDMLNKGSFYQKEKKNLKKIHLEIQEIKTDPNYISLKERLSLEKKKAEVDLKEKKGELSKAKSERKLKREDQRTKLKEVEFKNLEIQLNEESLKAKHFINNVKRYWEHTLNKLKNDLSHYENQIAELKELQKKKSLALQEFINNQYQFLNLKKETENLTDLFNDVPGDTIPSGAGECAAPKLLQHAFSNDLKPIAMAEFWWGNSPNKEVRKHKNFYHACQGKCKPILSHMLEGIEMDTNPLLQNPAIGKELEFIYEDEDLIVINKPQEFLSVPGIHIQDSVYSRIKKQVKDISGPIIIHRLDMSTSGLMVLAKNKIVHQKIQSQFINRTVKKRYTAVLDGIIKKDKGTIDLPLHGDFNDRPRQLVCHEYGKASKTNFEVINRDEGRTKILFYPITGRTHQLRMHASHAEGLNTPIKGDNLYGKISDRLYLHADTIEFDHPRTKKRMSFVNEAPF